MSKENEPMDPSFRETAKPEALTRRQRPCWAAQTLVAEVLALFPETPVGYSNPTAFNALLDVTFDFTVLDESDRDSAVLLMELLGDPAHNEDARIDSVIAGGADQEGQVLVSFIANARSQDSREPFGLADAWSTLTEEEQ